MNWIFSARTIIEEKDVSTAVDAARAIHKRFDHLYDALKWRLAREPNGTGERVPDMEGIYTAKTLNWDIEGVPVIQVIYRFTDNEVNILSILIQEL